MLAEIPVEPICPVTLILQESEELPLGGQAAAAPALKFVDLDPVVELPPQVPEGAACHVTALEEVQVTDGVWPAVTSTTEGCAAQLSVGVGVIVQSFSQPSAAIEFPSSQASLPVRLPFPQICSS